MFQQICLEKEVSHKRHIFPEIRLICTPCSPFCGDYHFVNFGDEDGGGRNIKVVGKCQPFLSKSIS